MNYEIEIIRKRNKNTYIRIKDNKVVVTTNYFVTKNEINNLIQKNKSTIDKMIEKHEKKIKFQSTFIYLNNKYDIIIVPTIENIEIDRSRIYVKSLEQLDKWLKKETISLFSEELKKVYHLFQEKIPYPKLKIRKMKTRWGVCNKNGSITLNSELIKYTMEEIDYVIVHELSHFVYFNHSKEFWNLVSKYCPNYKKCRKSLKY